MRKVNRVLFMGSKRLGLRVLQEMYALSPEKVVGVLTIDDTDDTRSVFPDIKDFSKRNRLKFHVAKNRAESESIIQDVAPDLCLVVGWYWLIRDIVLDAVPRGFIGVHNSLLPKFRGGSPLVWAIINGEHQVGVSFFSFRPGMDAGPIWAQGKVRVELQDYVSDVLDKLEEETVRLLKGSYWRILDGSIEPVDQDHEQATYCAQRMPSDGNVDWYAPAQKVYDFIRAQSDPYPGSFTYFKGEILKIWKAHLFDKTYYGKPGQVARIGDDGVYVVCGDHHAVILDEVEWKKERGEATRFIKSVRARMQMSS